MKLNISKFVTVTQKKNGDIKFKYEEGNKLEIFKFLKENGFGKAKIENRVIFFQRKENTLKAVHKEDVSFFFLEYLRSGEYEIPENVTRHQIINSYLEYLPIKENKMFHFLMKEELLESEVHELLFQSDSSYRHKYESSQIILKLMDWRFEKIQIGKKSNDPLYFKKVSKDTYIVFLHYNSSKPDNDGFDCTIGRYLSQKHIENESPLETLKFIRSFRLDRDLGQLKEFGLE